MRTFPSLQRSALAIAAVLAMLFTPTCGSLCAAMNHCSTITMSGNSDGCHHGDMSVQSDSDGSSVSAQASCGQQTQLLAILADYDSSAQLDSGSTASPVSIAATGLAVARNRHYQNVLPFESPQQTIPLENLSILRI